MNKLSQDIEKGIRNMVNEELFNNESLYPIISREFPGLPKNTNYAAFLRSEYNKLENLPVQSSKILGDFPPYTSGQRSCLEIAFKSPLNAISKNFTPYSAKLDSVNSINILKRKDQVVYLIELKSLDLDAKVIRYFNNPLGVWTFPGFQSIPYKYHNSGEEFESMCTAYEISQCIKAEMDYKNNIDFFLSRGIKELYVPCLESLLFRDRLVIDGFKLVQYNTTLIDYRWTTEDAVIPAYEVIKDKPSNIVTYFDYVKGGRKPPMIETIDGPITYYYLEHEKTGTKVLLFGDIHMRIKTNPCPTNENICPLIDYLRILMDYATNVQNIVLDVFLEQTYSGGILPEDNDLNDNRPYIYIINSLLSKCSGAGQCGLQHRIHATDIRPRLDVYKNNEGFVYKFLTNILTNEKLTDKHVYNIISSYVRAYPYLTDPLNDLMNIGKLPKQLRSIKDKTIVAKLVAILKNKYLKVNLSWKELVSTICKEYLDNPTFSKTKHALFSFVSEYQNIYFFARMFRDYDDTKGLYSKKPCNIIHYAGNSHIMSIKDILVGDFGFKVISEQSELPPLPRYKEYTQCVSIKNLKQPLFNNSACKNIDKLPVQEKNRGQIERKENFREVFNVKENVRTRYSANTLKLITETDSRLQFVKVRESVLYDSGFDEPYFFDEKYVTRLFNDVGENRETPEQVKAIRTLCFAYGIQASQYNIEALGTEINISGIDYNKSILQFANDPEVYIYPSMQVAFDEVKKGFMVKRKSIRNDTNIFSLRAVALKWKIPISAIKELSVKQLKAILMDKTNELYKIDYPFFTEEDKEYDKMIKNGSSLYLKTLAHILNLRIMNKDIEDIRSQVLETVTYMLVKPAKSRVK